MGNCAHSNEVEINQGFPDFHFGYVWKDLFEFPEKPVDFNCGSMRANSQVSDVIIDFHEVGRLNEVQVIVGGVERLRIVVGGVLFQKGEDLLQGLVHINQEVFFNFQFSEDFFLDILEKQFNVFHRVDAILSKNARGNLGHFCESLIKLVSNSQFGSVFEVESGIEVFLDPI